MFKRLRFGCVDVIREGLVAKCQQRYQKEIELHGVG
jgi:hypothetical protein